MTDIEPFPRIIQLLLDETKPFPSHHLHRFSDISPTDLKSILEVWPDLSSKRKLALLEDFELLADSDTLITFDDLARSLLKDNDAQVRVRAINLLWECSDPKLVPLYHSILNNDPDVNTRAAAASVLGQYIYLGEMDEISSELLHTIEEILLSTMKGDSPDLIKRRALEALGASSLSEVPQLIETAYHRKSTEWKVSALHAMGRSSDEHWEKYIIAHLFDQEQEIKSEAINAAGKLELESARTSLLDLLEDEEEQEIRQEIIWSLSCIGGEGVRSRLEEILELADEDEVDFLEEAVENLLLTEELDQFSLLNLDADPQEDE